jgi:hypothetical protein
VHEVLGSPGQPLDPVARTFMEPRFGQDFSRVRVHTGTRAAQSARAVNASAYTVGSDIVFGEGRYAPHTNEGRGLLAHELTHTVQQRMSRPSLSRLAFGRPSAAPEEREADRVRAEIQSGSPAIAVRERVAPSLARDEGSPAGGCGVCYGTPKDVGTAVHAILSVAFRRLGFEAPYGHSRELNRPKLAASPTDENFVLDLARPHGREGIVIGEIKPANAAGLIQGDMDVTWYEMQLEKFGFEVGRLELPPPIDPIPFPTLAPAPCPEFQNLYVNTPVLGVYTYWCTPDFKELIGKCPCKDDEESEEQKKSQLAQAALRVGQEIARRQIKRKVVRKVAEKAVTWGVRAAAGGGGTAVAAGGGGTAAVAGGGATALAAGALPVLGMAGVFVALGSGYAQAREAVRNDYTASGFSQGFVMGLLGWEWRHAADRFGVRSVTPDPWDEALGYIRVNAYNRGLRAGYFAGAGLAADQKKAYLSAIRKFTGRRATTSWSREDQKSYVIELAAVARTHFLKPE